MVAFYLLAFCRIVIGLVFTLSFWGKIRHLPQFRQTIMQFGLFPARLNDIAAAVLLGGELAIVLSVAIGDRLLVVGFVLAIVLLLIFCGALLFVLIRKIRTTCNCFGIGENLVSVVDIWRNIFSGCIRFSTPRATAR